VQAFGWEARSARSQRSWGEPAEQLTLEQFEFSAIRCQAPTSKL
jgi:hypothetical protein